jgi:hypothetical protein
MEVGGMILSHILSVIIQYRFSKEGDISGVPVVKPEYHFTPKDSLRMVS